MYHIKNDKRSRLSAERISDALFQCLKEKEWKDISVSEIQRISYVSRATFYRTFDSLSDVLAYRCDLVMEQVIQCQEEEKKDKGIYFCECWMKNAFLLETIINSHQNDILYQSSLRNAEEMMKILNIRESVPYEERENLVSVFSSVQIAVFSIWVKNGKKEDARQLMKQVELWIGTLWNIIRS